MASHKENDDVPMLPISDSSSRTRPFTSRSRSVSLASTSSTIDRLDSSTVVLGDTGPLQTQRSGKSGMCNDPYRTTSPSHYNPQAAQNLTSRDTVDSTFRNCLYDYAERFAHRYKPRILKLYSRFKWEIFFARSCLLPIFVDPLFVFLIKVKHEGKCLSIDWRMAKAYVAFRTLMDVLFTLNILRQFRLAYVARESTGEFVFDSQEDARRRYFRGKFLLDLFIVMPLPQILILWVIPTHLDASGENNAKSRLVVAVLFQYISKLYRLLPFLAGLTQTTFIFESAWAIFILNLLTFILGGHFVGSCWYHFGLQKVNQCLRDACGNYDRACIDLIDCGRAKTDVALAAWKDNANASACFQEDGFDYGIYSRAVNLTHHSNPFTRYTYSLFWGFQQISTLAGNQVPSYVFWEALFTMGIIGLGLFLFALLVGNMLFTLLIGQRNLEWTQRRRDVKHWLHRRQLPASIRKRVEEAERFNWAGTNGINEEMLFENMPDDIQRDIRRHLFKFLYKVNIFSGMNELLLDAIRGRLKQKIYIKNSMVLHRGGLLDQMVFIMRGEMESIREDGSVLRLSEGDVCGEELLNLCLECSSSNSDEKMIRRFPSKGLLSNTHVRCVTNVEAFSLSVADLEDVRSLFSRFLNHRVQRADSSGLEIPKETSS